jgi:DnaJ homolog subfamily C member 17
MAKDDLMQHATNTVDFYDLLGVTFETSESDIRRAYRKTALKYHPDKLGKDFDPERFHLLQIAHDVLSDPVAKAAYDNARNARLQKQRQNELFEGKRRKMKEDLEARERGGSSPVPVGAKRAREADEMEEIRRLAEEGRRRRREMEEKMKAHGGASPSAPEPTVAKPELAKPAVESEKAAEEAAEEDEIARLERRIREAEEAKARRRAERRARKSGVFVPGDSPNTGTQWAKPPAKEVEQDTATPIKRPDTLKGTNASEKLLATPKFSFTPTKPTSIRNEFSATMERLKAAEKQRLEDEIRRQEAEAASSHGLVRDV